jgi:hypothetical protein
VRGDGPGLGAVLSITDAYSPRARGWTAESVRVSLSHRVFPACAGMDRIHRSVSGAMCRIPRVRGDGPDPPRDHPEFLGYSPRARGWTETRSRFEFDSTVFPACAGMDRATRLVTASWSGIPRVRGDGPKPTRTRLHVGRYSPRARGWTGWREFAQVEVRVFPACAGMDRSHSTKCSARSGIPRVRGDGPVGSYDRQRNGWYSPRARGWTEPQKSPPVDVAVFQRPRGLPPRRTPSTFTVHEPRTMADYQHRNRPAHFHWIRHGARSRIERRRDGRRMAGPAPHR